MSLSHSPSLTQGLYSSEHEHDACGIGFVAHIKGQKNHSIVEQGLEILRNLDHRGAVGADPNVGDGAGILVQIPHKFLNAKCEQLGFELPTEGAYGVGTLFLPRGSVDKYKSIVTSIFEEMELCTLGWREVPVDNKELGAPAIAVEPLIFQVFVTCKQVPQQDTMTAFEGQLFVTLKQIEQAIQKSDFADKTHFYVASLSSQTLVYKGMLLAHQLENYFLDLKEPMFTSALALVHQRFSTNTFPTWDLAQPFRMVAHNGEINTVRGNVNWMAARKFSMSSKTLGEDLRKLWPLIRKGKSDTACFDNALELLVAGGYSLAHAIMILIPEAWAGNPLMDSKLRAFYEYHAALMEPWDGPAAIAFTDGKQIGATLDRNGLRPARFLITDDDLVVMASEMGVLPIPEERIVKKWRLQPGKMLLIDLVEGRIIDDKEIKESLASQAPYQKWLQASQIRLEELPREIPAMPPDPVTLKDRQRAFGYTNEDFKFILKPMSLTSQDPIGSMGIDTALAAFSNRPKLLFDYFKQGFAQVTNPPIDPIREELVMSLVSLIGPRPNLLALNNEESPKRLEVRQPILTNEDLERVRRIEARTQGAFQTKTISICTPTKKGPLGMRQSLDKLCERAELAVAQGNNIIILSDRLMDAGQVAIPALLASSAVHCHLIREGLRTQVGLVLETGEAREVHHFAVLAGYGAEAINPYLALDSLSMIKDLLSEPLTLKECQKRYIKAINKGLLKVMSKMGISCFQSYCGAQIFNSVGLSAELLNAHFTGTSSPLGGAGLEEIALETFQRHREAFPPLPKPLHQGLDVGGESAQRVTGEPHMWNLHTISSLQHAVRAKDYVKFKDFSTAIDKSSRDLMNVRGLLAFNAKNSGIPIASVEPASEIVKRFSTGAMSFGSISYEAHTTLAIAMNRLGGKSNTGEGGELAERFNSLPNGDSMRSAIKQVASGRFGVTADYLVNADEIQIKMAQGAKPGEGGQLPGHKVDRVIARVRMATPGVGLISPPPHHDIYSIEDLAQLIYDLKNVNPTATISVKLVSLVGVGTVAAGVTKSHADHLTISGYDGGTGASPMTSIKHAGLPWEIGLSETHQTLVLNGLRQRIRVQTDGGLRTGRDVVIGALLGADEFGFSTAPLIAEGCLMMRKCHLNTCPVGIATQDPELRKRFTGQPDHVVNYFFFVAEEVRELMAELGVAKFDDLIGQVDQLKLRENIHHWKAKNLDLSKLLYKPEVAAGEKCYHTQSQNHELEKCLDQEVIAKAQAALSEGAAITMDLKINNTCRSFGAMLSGEVAKKYGPEGMMDDSILINLTGTAGQSFGAFLAAGIAIHLKGEANDYVGKGLCGGRLVVVPPATSNLVPHENIIIGNTALYGATEGEAYFCGIAGERFAVRNSGATAVVEGLGDHGCEYMTRGTVVVLGPTGRNFAAGMSGGLAYVLDETGDFAKRCNLTMVELEPLLEEDAALEDLEHQGGDLETQGRVDVSSNMSHSDSLSLKALIESHRQYTNSPHAKEILAHWNVYLPKFVKVVPVKYQQVLERIQRQTQNSNPTMEVPPHG